jgi:SAM-dependent methyltransferase
MDEPPRVDVWASGARYEAYVGRWSRLVAPEFLAWLEVPAGARWLDVGCGTGVLTEAVLGRHGPASVVGVDRSPEFVAHARAQVRDARAAFEVGDAQSLPLEDASMDAAVSGLVLNFVEEPARAVEELARVLRPGGVAGAYVWDYGGEMQMMRHFWDAAAEVDPGARSLDESQRSVVRDAAALEALFSARFGQVATRGVVIPTVFRDFEDYWSPFLGGTGAAPAYCASLDEGQRARLRDALEYRLPGAEDGSIRLSARAWAVRGRRERGR